MWGKYPQGRNSVVIAGPGADAVLKNEGVILGRQTIRPN